MSFIVVIPARYASTRLPGKPLLDLAGKPMLQHVYERALKSRASAVYIATDDERIAEAASRFTHNVCMTASNHQSGTDRIQEVAMQLGLSEDSILVNVQGDEPLIPPAAIDLVAADLRANPQAGISSLYESLQDREDYLNVNAVKVVIDEQGYALYFSRAAIPWQDGEGSFDHAQAKRHIGIYAYRVSTLNAFVGWPVARLESLERLEQLRALYHGIRIHLQAAPERIPPGVDTLADLEAVRRQLAAWQGSS